MDKERWNSDEAEKREYHKTAARNFESAGRYEEAALSYERAGLWADAGRVRNISKTNSNVTTVKHITIDINDLLNQVSSNGLVVKYDCPHCGAGISYGKGSDQGLKFCSYCGSSIDTELLATILKNAIK